MTRLKVYEKYDFEKWEIKIPDEMTVDLLENDRITSKALLAVVRPLACYQHALSMAAQGLCKVPVRSL